MKKVVLSLVLGIMLIGVFALVAAQNTDAGNNMTAEARQAQQAIQTNTQERMQLNREEMSNIRERLGDGEELNFSERKIVLKRINAEIMELKTERAVIKTRLNLTNEDNTSQLKARLSNGRNVEIKIMPEVASERALERLRLKRCNESENCTIELKEVGEGNRTRLAYEIRARKMFKIWGFIKNHEEVRVRIDAETGEEIEIKRPWWAWMASESDEAE